VNGQKKSEIKNRKSKMILQSMAIELPRLDYHPNRAPFRGVLTLVDAPSDKPPAGARGHRVLLTRVAAEHALPSLLGMGLDYTPALDQHDARRKVGVITEAEIVPRSDVVPGFSSPVLRNHGQRGTGGGERLLTVAGYLFARDFPEVMRELRAATQPRAAVPQKHAAPHRLGMSYEIADAHVEDPGAAIWNITQFTFTGAAMLRRDKAAYRDTWIELT
jgi:hypothetical protein